MKKINDIFKEILEISFIKEHFLLITNILIIIWFILIIKLWLISFWISTGWGWFIDLGFPHLNFEAWKPFYIFFWIFVISFFFWLLNRWSKKIKKLKIAVLIFLIWLFAKQIFYLFAPEYEFHMVDEKYQYVDNNKNVNLDKFFKLYKKYCENDKYDVSIKWIYYTCSWKFWFDLKTVEEFIKMFEFAKENDFRQVYNITYRKIWESPDKDMMGKLIESYNDKTFYAYVISSWLDDNLLKIIYDKINDLEIINLIDYITNTTMNYKKIVDNLSSDEKNDYWDEFNINIKNIIKKLNWVNLYVF